MPGRSHDLSAATGRAGDSQQGSPWPTSPRDCSWRADADNVHSAFGLKLNYKEPVLQAINVEVFWV